MITKPTVLVLGAGASFDYGFPLGRRLLFEICESLAKTSNPQRMMLTALKYPTEEIENFRSQLLHSSQMSIDAFLGHRTNLRSIGKAAIACQLIPCENEANLFRSKDKMKWYEYLFSNLSADATTDTFKNNKLSIITFNYDRSLEHYLFRSLVHCYGLRAEQAVPLLQTISIVHVYGKLGELDYVDPERGRAYTVELNTETVLKSAESIKVLHEDQPDSEEFKDAHHLMMEAETICFLGFGYHPENMNRLLAKPHRFSGRSFLCSAYDLKTAEIDSCRSKWFINIDRRKLVKFGGPAQETLEFIREFVVLE